MRIILSALLASAIGFSAYAASGVATILSGVSAASGTSGEIQTAGNTHLRVQACGTSFSGVVTIKQGEFTGKLTPTKTITLTSNSDCTSYYILQPSALTEVAYTRSAGTLTVYLGADDK